MNEYLAYVHSSVQQLNFIKRKMNTLDVSSHWNESSSVSLQTNVDQQTDTSPIMKWNCIEGKLSLKLLLMIAMLNAFSAEDCCKRPMTAYGDKEAFPTECDKSKCTEEVIYAENALSGEDVSKFLSSVRKSNTITMVGNTTSYTVANLVEIVHKGPGPAITLQNVVLSMGSFKKLKTIKVDDVSIYCDGTTDLIKIEGSIPQDILDQLHKVENKTLAACKSLTTTQPTVLGATQGVGVSSSNSSAVISPLCTQKIDAEKEKCSSNNTLLYIACAVIVVLLIVSIVSTIIALKLYFCHKKDRPSASLGGSNETHQLMAITQAGVWEVEAHRILYDVPNSVEAMTICKFKPTPRPPGHSEKYREHHGFS
ncbi:unnamed protein product [Caenorhabditis auriculariae]|uniref:Uncharacterized protein n=1 Tax=Caenorhabditis auriculariae TaxID=2777116 RepID=A0A8S1HRY8_9PELO|nr:unnamed protein product [Caenorhabditis auriculariae]